MLCHGEKILLILLIGGNRDVAYLQDFGIKFDKKFTKILPSQDKYS